MEFQPSPTKLGRPKTSTSKTSALPNVSIACMSGVWEIRACWNRNGIISEIGEVIEEADIHLLELLDSIPARLGDKAIAQVRQECQVANCHDS